MKTKTNLLAAGIFLAALVNVFSHPLSTVQFSSAGYTADENAGTVTLTVERIGEPGGTAYVEYVTRNNATAIAGEDYVGRVGSLRFVGETNPTIVIPILNDAVAERDETFSVFLFNPDSVDTQLGAATDAVVTILDDDRGVEFGPATYTVEEGAGNVIITVRARTESTNGFCIDYFTGGCSATAGLDYLPQTGTLTFLAGETEKTFLIPIIDDAIVEGDETVALSLCHPVGIMLGVNRNAVLWIQDNDNELANAPGVDLAPQRKGYAAVPMEGPRDLAVSGNYAYVADGSAGLRIIDISDPSAPRPVGRTTTIGDANAVAIACNHALVAEGVGFAVFDVSVPVNPRRVGKYGDEGALCPRYDAIVVEGNRAIATWCAGCFWPTFDIVDIADPATPRLLGAFSYLASPRQMNVAVSGNYVYARIYGFRVLVIDISDPTYPQIVSGFGRGFPDTVAVSGQYAYTLSSDSSLVVNLGVFDISKPTNPREVGTYATTIPAGSQPLKVAVRGAYAFIYGSGGGLAQIDIRDPAHPRQVGCYGTSDGPLVLTGNYAYVANSRGLEIFDLTPRGFHLAITPFDDLVEITLNTCPGQIYAVEASTNLVDWESIAGDTIALESHLSVCDFRNPKIHRRFYRGVRR